MAPPRSSTRLSTNREKHSQSSLNKFLVNTSHLDQQKKQQHSIVPEMKHITPDNKILEGVVACLDVRTEDGDDVSQNFERALQSMGAKTRRAFSDSCTHLIFKNGSPATIKKALLKNVHIINLLWISRCKKEGKRLSEQDFVIERPQSLVLAAKKRRKSMEPSKVRALGADVDMDNATSSSDGSSPTEDLYELRNQRLEEERRKTIGVPSYKRRQLDKEGIERKAIESQEEEENYKHKVRFSLPLSVEAKTGRHQQLNRIKPAPVAPSPEMKEHIKARFSIGKKVDDENEDTKERALLFPSLSVNTHGPIRRKRRLTGNATTPRQSIVDHIPSSSSTPALSSLSSMPPVAQSLRPNIVFSCLDFNERAGYEKIVKSLGVYEVGNVVNNQTTHVLVGSRKRSKSAALGLVKGLWILNFQWLIASKQKGQYVEEGPYELQQWFPGAPVARQKIPFMPSTTCIKVHKNVKSGHKFVEELIKGVGGRLVQEIENANVVISSEPLNIEKIVVKEEWIFESIEMWKYLSNNGYEP